MSVTDFKIIKEKIPLKSSNENQKSIGPTIWEETTSYSGKNLWIGICFFLVELFERFTFFGVVCNMIPFCTIQLGHQNSQAAILNLCFIGTSTLTPLLVGWFVDVCGERNKLVYICLFLHFLGECLLWEGIFSHLIDNC